MRTPMVATLYDDYFIVEPSTSDWICTVRSVTGHELYERTDPHVQAEPEEFSTCPKLRLPSTMKEV